VLDFTSFHVISIFQTKKGIQGIFEVKIISVFSFKVNDTQVLVLLKISFNKFKVSIVL
jgi:hypothetical protein